MQINFEVIPAQWAKIRYGLEFLGLVQSIVYRRVKSKGT